MAKYKPYNSVKVDGKMYHDYSIRIKGIIYDCSYCEETKELRIRKDEWQRGEGIKGGTHESKG